MTAVTGSPVVLKLSPTDLTFLWDDCQRCFWLKCKGILKRPAGPFPKVFNRLDGLTKDHFYGKRSEDMADGLQPGRIAFGERWVRSAPLCVPGHKTRVTIAGKLDTALAFDDGSFGIIDFKTSTPRTEHVYFYGRQLHAYALAAENPAPGALELFPVAQLGLLCLDPVGTVALGPAMGFQCDSRFLEVERDDDAFMAFLSEVLFVLERSEPPDPAPKCPYCRFLAAGSLMLLTGIYESD